MSAVADPETNKKYLDSKLATKQFRNYRKISNGRNSKKYGNDKEEKLREIRAILEMMKIFSPPVACLSTAFSFFLSLYQPV